MLRNLNQSFARGRICGTPKCGVLGSAIPSSGANGPGYAYNDLALPADANKEICGRITTWPATGALFAYEDTSFDYTPAGDGATSFTYQLYVDGAAVGTPQTVTLTSGASGATINAAVGSAIASGMDANVALNVTILGTVGAAAATGLSAGVGQGATIAASTGTASANGFTSDVENPQGITILCSVGVGVATGGTGAVSQSGSFARAPAGDGYRPRRERQGPIRTADIQGYDR